jgi:hypothetical protein
MKIETKYSVGDTVWYMRDNKVRCDTIVNVCVDINSKTQDNTYTLKINQSYLQFAETYLFTSKEELLSSL